MFVRAYGAHDLNPLLLRTPFPHFKIPKIGKHLIVIGIFTVERAGYFLSLVAPYTWGPGINGVSDLMLWDSTLEKAVALALFDLLLQLTVLRFSDGQTLGLLRRVHCGHHSCNTQALSALSLSTEWLKGTPSYITTPSNSQESPLCM